MSPEPTYDPDDGVYRAPIDWRDAEGVTTTVVESVAAVKAVATTDLPPLDDAVDADALGQLFGPRYGTSLRDDGHVTFPFDEFRVTVRADGVLELDPAEWDGTPD